MWTIEQLAYLAGIIDGEGSVGIERLKPTKGRKKDYYVCRLTVINTSFKLVKWLKDNFKGNFDLRKAIPGRKNIYRWHVFGKDLENILKAIEPFLLIKRIQANLIIKYRLTVGKTGWNVSDDILKQRHDLWQQCSDWNKIGPV